MRAEQESDYQWPEPCRASLLAQLAATSAADEAARWARLLGGAS